MTAFSRTLYTSPGTPIAPFPPVPGGWKSHITSPGPSLQLLAQRSPHSQIPVQSPSSLLTYYPTRAPNQKAGGCSNIC